MTGPYTDPSRVIQVDGATMIEGTNVWFLPDRRDQNITATVQVRYYDRGRAEWYKAHPQWFDSNMDSPRYLMGAPNDLVITGIAGHPFPRNEVSAAIRILAVWLYWVAKSGVSGYVTAPTGETIELGAEPPRYADFVREWRIRTAVVAP